MHPVVGKQFGAFDAVGGRFSRTHTMYPEVTFTLVQLPLQSDFDPVMKAW